MTIIDEIKNIVGADHVLLKEAVAERAQHFWNPSPMVASALVRPANTEEVSQVLKICHQHNQPVVTHGGLTGLAEGEKSTEQDIVLSLERMREIESLDVTGRTMTVQAGCILQTVHEAAAEAGLKYGLDLGARGSCTIGGNISTNAGGLSVLRYGMTRDQILGLEAVLANGTVLSSMNTMMKNNAGYDLKQLFIGSEGTLGVVTRAVLRLRPNTPTVHTALVAFENYDQVTDTLNHMSSALNEELNAFEILWNDYYRLSTDPSIKGTARAPIQNDSYAYAIIEARGSNQDTDEEKFIQTLERVMEKELITDAVIAQSESERSGIWQIRENVDLTLRHHPHFNYDISLPISSMHTYLEEVTSTLRPHWPDVIVYAYGHLADSNLHIIVVPEPANFIKDPDKQPKWIETNDATENEWHELSNKALNHWQSSAGQFQQNTALVL